MVGQSNGGGGNLRIRAQFVIKAPSGKMNFAHWPSKLAMNIGRRRSIKSILLEIFNLVLEGQ